MADGTNKICHFNNIGYCKFGIHCQKKHCNIVCELLDDCTEKNCEKRHPKICRYFSENTLCRFKEGCAYTHKEKENIQTKVIGQITSCIMKHEKDITTLNEEIIMLKNLVENMALQLMQHFSKKVESNEKEKTEDIETIKSAPLEHVFKCEKCEYTAEKEITLKKHINTKHIEQKSQSEVKKHENRVNFFCDECNFTCKTKKNLNKHKEKNHHIQVVNKQSSTQEGQRLFNSEMASACLCTTVTVCDVCLVNGSKKNNK